MGESKQVKVDNWGIFFLQRLQHFFTKTYFCDLTLQFEDNVQLKVHRLVLNACTEYFQMLEQTCEMINDCLIMPPDLQTDVVVPIINFMYTGILEYKGSNFDRLYTTARFMNMTVLTKLLDAQKVPIAPIPKPVNKRPVAPITWNLQGKRIQPKTMDPDLPEPLPGRKLPIWKRKSVPGAGSYRGSESSLPDPLSTKYFRSSADETPKPTRFEWPDDEDTNSLDTSSFDKISYTSKPLIPPARERSPKPSTSNFEDLKRSSGPAVPLKRPLSPVQNESAKRVNIQDVKEYIKEQKLRSDYIDYDDSEAADNDLQTYDDDDSGDEGGNKDVFEQSVEETPNKSILKNDATTSPNKRVRFSLDGNKENANKGPPPLQGPNKTAQNTTDMSNHTKIITEVLKKYPHLVKKNKNIRLKILAKGASSSGQNPAGTPVKIVKPASKVSYMVMKPEQNKPGNSQSSDNKKDGHWSCHRCSNPNPLQFDTYYLYRKHLTEAHNEKVDSQMCNICGHVSRKQNMLLYHKYVKHNIAPPPLYKFPRCKECPYVALSPTMLTKHQVTHTHQVKRLPGDFACAECQAPFHTKSALVSHIQLTGHHSEVPLQTFDCDHCTKKFISSETLLQHVKKNHSQEAEADADAPEDIIMVEDEGGEQKMAKSPGGSPKKKIKILSDIKVNNPINSDKLLKQISPVQTEPKVEPSADTQPLEPSSEAESLSNVASGIAASLGLVNTIVVLDENQFSDQNFILPDVTTIDNLHVSQHQVITDENSAIISPAALNKTNIKSTDELVMVLTDHDYSDASSNAVLTSENSSNIVVLYSHPVQNQDGQFLSQQGMVINADNMGIVEVHNHDYAVANAVAIEDKHCEESIEMIQQEINNHLEADNHPDISGDIPGDAGPKVLDEQIIGFEEEKEEILPDSGDSLEPKDTVIKMEVDPPEVDAADVDRPEVDAVESMDANLVAAEFDFVKNTELQPEIIAPIDSNPQPTRFDEPMEIEESIEQIQKEIHKNDLPEICENAGGTLQEQQSENANSLQTNTSSSISIVDERELVVESKSLHEEEGGGEVVEDQGGKSDEEETFDKSLQEDCRQPLEKDLKEPAQEIEASQKGSECVEEAKGSFEPDQLDQSEQMEVDSSRLSGEVAAAKPESSDVIVPDSEEEKALSEASEGLPVDLHKWQLPSPAPEFNPARNSLEENAALEGQKCSNLEPQKTDLETRNSDREEENPPEENPSSHEPSKEEEGQLENDLQMTAASQDPEPENDEPEPENDEPEQENEEPEPENDEPEQENEELEEKSEESASVDTVDNTNEEEKSVPSSSLQASKPRSPEIKCGKSTDLITNSKISNLLDDWDDGDTDSQQSDAPKAPVDNTNSINTLINDWEDEEDT